VSSAKLTKIQEEQMKILIVAAALVLSVLVPVAYADEGSLKVIAEDLLLTMKADQMVKPLFEQMRVMMDQQFTQMGVSEDMIAIRRRFMDKFLNIMEEMMSWQTMKEDMITIYVQAFTEDELKGMLAFYKTPVGQSVIEKMPVAMKQSMAIMQKYMPELQEKVNKICEEMAEEIRAEKEKREKAGGGN
jgi:uncharacterized protein